MAGGPGQLLLVLWLGFGGLWCRTGLAAAAQDTQRPQRGARYTYAAAYAHFAALAACCARVVPVLLRKLVVCSGRADLAGGSELRAWGYSIEIALLKRNCPRFWLCIHMCIAAPGVSLVAAC